MNQIRMRTCFVVVGCALTAQTALAGGWVQWPVNGHEYQVVVEPLGISWTAADAAAQAMGGHLASITSAEENAFVFSLIDAPEFWQPHLSFTGVEFNMGPWIGGFQAAGATEPGDGWAWTTSESFDFKGWLPGEPNEGPIPGELTENRMCFWVRDSLTNRGSTWNDFHDSGCWDGDCIISFVVERSCNALTMEGPSPVSVCAGGTAIFSVSPTGAGPFAYAWQKGGLPLIDDVHVTGSDTEILTITGVTADDVDSYTCLVSDSCAPVLSAAAALTLLADATVDGPVDQSACAGGTAVLVVTPAGAGPFTYAWHKGGLPLVDDAHITGSDTDTLTITAVSATDVDSYACLVTGACGPVLSAAADLVVFPTGTGDGDASGTVDGLDIAGFVAAATNAPAAMPAYCAYDMNTDGVVDADDLPVFIALLIP